MTLDPGGLLAWLTVGLIAGWLANYNVATDAIAAAFHKLAGIVGAFVGGFLFSLLLPGSSAGLFGSIVVAFIGAVVLIAVVRALPGRSPV